MSSKIRPSRRHFLCASFLLLQISGGLSAAGIESRQGKNSDPFVAPRRLMVERDLKGRGIKDPRVLAAMETVPRHLFVPDPQKDAAYDDRPLPIGAG